MATYRRSLVWLRRDLRLHDNVALARAAALSDEIVCAFVLDPRLLRGPRMGAPIVRFFFSALAGLRVALRAEGSDLALLEGDFAHELARLARDVDAQAVFYNEDYDPTAIARDDAVTKELRERGLAVEIATDHVYMGADDVVQESGKIYTVFTPYKRRWLATHESEPRPALGARGVLAKLAPKAAIGTTLDVPEPKKYGYTVKETYPVGDEASARKTLAAFLAKKIGTYGDARNDPALDGTSHLSVHLRAGTIGIRTCVAAAFDARANGTPDEKKNADVWISELAWRDFYQQLLKHVPRVADEPFVEAAKTIPYLKNERDYTAWEEGRTGYPIVDAAMRQIATYGWMHNRLRMVVASFLTKHQLHDYREGERYFETQLADADLAANNGGWQWSASTGVDPQPYFRVFNPTLQAQTYDPDGTFIKQMLPELAPLPPRYVHAPWTLPPLLAAELNFKPGRDYPDPIVDHAEARQRALDIYGAALGRGKRI
jgi:deoxyribodipyrimidine photo-lyase